MLHPKAASAVNGLATADNGRIVILEPHKWIGHRLPVLTHIVSGLRSHPAASRLHQAEDHRQDADATGVAGSHNTPLNQRLARGNWIVMFYHASCDQCRATIPVYEQLAQSELLAGKTPHVAFVRVPSGSGFSSHGLFHSNLAIHATLDATHDWFAQTPIVLQLHNGIVMAIATGHAAMKLNLLE
jgi:hypothetical protein